MRTIRYNVYKFDELPEDAKQKAITKLYDVNTQDDWYDSVYEDAKNIGCKIIAFDIDRGSFCEMEFGYTDEVIKVILKNHGESCDTYKLAKEYQDKIFDDEALFIGDNCDEFKKELQEEYLSMLRREYEYLTSEEVIIETIEANDYEFKLDGTLE